MTHEAARIWLAANVPSRHYDHDTVQSLSSLIAKAADEARRKERRDRDEEAERRARRDAWASAEIQRIRARVGALLALLADEVPLGDLSTAAHATPLLSDAPDWALSLVDHAARDLRDDQLQALAASFRTERPGYDKAGSYGYGRRIAERRSSGTGAFIAGLLVGGSL